MSIDHAIHVENLYKRFRIPLDRSSTLKHRVTHPRAASRFRVLEALKDVSFDVPEGQFIGIIGHNGSGKSTLLKVLAHIYQADAGRISIKGAISPFLELGVGFNPELTARENVFLSGAVLGLGRAELRRRFDDVIGFAELEQFVDHKLKNFSTGMEVRLAFALAIQAHAEILMMDEVLAVGDAAFQQKCFDTFNRYKREGRTIVFVTQDLGTVNRYCDRAILLDQGRLVADGAPTEITATYRGSIGVSADDGRKVGEQMERWGTREAVIEGVRLLGETGVEDLHPLTGGHVRIEIAYEIKNMTIAEFLCVMWIVRNDGTLVSEESLPVTQYGNAGLASASGAGVIRYDLPRLPLRKGGYHVNVELRERRGQSAYDHIDRAVRFRVVDTQPGQGLISPGGTWSVVPRGPAVAGFSDMAVRSGTGSGDAGI